MNSPLFDPENTQQKNALSEAFSNLTIASLSGTFTFTQYTKTVLSQDGYVFWVAGSNTLTVKGALHVSTDREQDTDKTIAMNVVMLDSEGVINEFNKEDSGVLWVGEIPIPDGGTVKAAFQRRGPFFKNAGIYHYMGYSVFPQFSDILVASSSDIPAGPIVSNSLPIWLGMQAFLQNVPTITWDTSIPFYPSFLVPENVKPPYVVVHIDPDWTDSVQPVPQYPYSGNALGPTDVPSLQLYSDRVELLCYGLNNQQVLQLQAAILEYQLFSGQFGFTTTPVIRDLKDPMAELQAIALKKSLVFQANYYMQSADAMAKQIIEAATISYNVEAA